MEEKNIHRSRNSDVQKKPDSKRYHIIRRNPNKVVYMEENTYIFNNQKIQEQIL